MALFAGLSALAGGLGNTQAARTTTTNGTQSQTGGSSATTSRNLAPQQQSSLDTLGPLIQQMIANPGSITEPIRQSNRQAANAAFTGQPQAIADQFGTGGGASGVSGKVQVASDLARRSSLAGADQAANLQQAQVQQGGAGLAMQLLGQNFGSTTSGTTDSTTSSNGTSIGPGSAAGGAVGGGLSGLAAMMAMMGMMGGGGGGYGAEPNYGSGPVNPNWYQQGNSGG